MTINWKEHKYNNTSSFSLQNLECYCRVVKIHDGDTFTIILPVFNSFYRFSVRLVDIDTCEIKSNNPTCKMIATNARKRLFELVTKQTSDLSDSFLSDNVNLVYIKCKDFDKYGRLLGDVYKTDEDDISFSEILMEEKLAYFYDGKKKLTEEEQIEILKK
jgi:endonuclease YncB( thermonuclease family)